MADFGTDIACATDTGPTWALASGTRNLGNALVRRLSTQYGALAAIDPDAADYGLDLRSMIGGPSTIGFAAFYQTAIAAECEKDERVLSAAVTIRDFNPASPSATISIAITTAAGPFTLVLSVTAVTVAVLNQGPTQ